MSEIPGEAAEPSVRDARIGRLRAERGAARATERAAALNCLIGGLGALGCGGLGALGFSTAVRYDQSTDAPNVIATIALGMLTVLGLGQSVVGVLMVRRSRQGSPVLRSVCVVSLAVGGLTGFVVAGLASLVVSAQVLNGESATAVSTTGLITLAFVVIGFLPPVATLLAMRRLAEADTARR